MNKNVLKSFVSIICLIAFINIVTLLVPVFSVSTVGASSSVQNLYGYEIIAKLISGKFTDTAMIVFGIDYAVMIVASLFMIIDTLTHIKTEKYASKTTVSYSIFVFIFALVFCVFVSVLINQPDLNTLLGETNAVTFKSGASCYIAMILSAINIVLCLVARKYALSSEEWLWLYYQVTTQGLN